MKSRREEIGLRIIALIVCLNGCFVLFGELFIRFPGRINTILPLSYWYYHRPIHVLLGFLLIYFSLKLYERKRFAWIITTGSTIIIILSTIIHGIAFVHLIIPLLTLFLLLYSSSLFKVKGDSESVKHGIIFTLISLCVAIVYGTFGFYLLDKKDFGIDFHIMDSLVRVLREYTLIGNDDLVPHTRFAAWFLTSLDSIGIISIGFSLYSLFKPLTYRFTTLPHEKEKARMLIQRYSETTEDFFKLWPEDKQYYFLPSEDAFIAYTISKDVAVVHSDPVGDKKSIAPVITSFLSFCEEQGLSCLFLHTSSTNLALYKEHGFIAIKIGEDAIINLATFSEKTRKKKYFRNIVNRFPRMGYQMKVYEPPLSQSFLKKLSAVSKDWSIQKGKKERSFAMGYFNQTYLRTCRVYTLEHNRTIYAFINEVPFRLPERITIDLIRYRKDIPPGGIDYLITQILLYLQGKHVAFFDLGLAPYSGIYDEITSSPLQLLFKKLYESNFPLPHKGLRLFKQKYDPEWKARYIVLRTGPANLIKASLGISSIMKLPHKKK